MNRFGLSLGLLLVLGGCGRVALPPPDLAVSMRGDEVRYEEFELYLSRTLGEQDAAMASDVLSGLLDQFLDERVLRRWIDEEMSLEVYPEEDPLLVLLEQLPGTTVDEDAVAAYYDDHLPDYRLPERVRLRQILVEDLELARQARAELLSGVDFVTVADRHARHPYTPSGGDQGVLARDDLPPPLSEVVFALGEGEFSDIVTADYGHHIFQVVEKLPARAVSLDEARGDIERRLRRRQADAELAELVDRARTRYNVRVHRRNLPFNYDGRYLSEPPTSESSDHADD